MDACFVSFVVFGLIALVECFSPNQVSALLCAECQHCAMFEELFCTGDLGFLLSYDEFFLQFQYVKLTHPGAVAPQIFNWVTRACVVDMFYA
jgi:hypothetical protein